LAALLLGTHGLFSATLAHAGGWVGLFPKDLVKPDSGHRNHVFYVGEPITFKLEGTRLDRYEVRDYWGNLIDQGPAAETITPRASLPGWYKLYVYGKKPELAKPKSDVEKLLDAPPEPAASSLPKDGKPPKPPVDYPAIWGDSLGATTFCIFRNDPRFPPLPPKGTRGSFGGKGDQVLRGVTGMGPQRHAAFADKPDETIKQLSFDVEIDKKFYLPFDPLRPRKLFFAFPNGTKDEASVRKIVEHFKADVKYYEPRNEPNYGASGAQFVEKELKPFHKLVKSVGPDLKVMGPGTVSIGPNNHGLNWIEDFLKAGGHQYLDAFSFHAYNTVNGDLWLARKALDSLTELLKKYGADKLEKWQTEQGFMACVYGSYQPRLQGRWTMVEMMVYEQYGIPKEHNHLWYDVSHGFWDFPTWWENDDGGLNPAAPLMRVWSEELFGTRFAKAFDFGDPGNKLYVGSLFTGPDKQVAAFLSAGSTDGRVELAVNGGQTLRVVSAFGVEKQVPVVNGRAVIDVPELPVYVELAKGQTIDVVPTAWGENLARQKGVTASSSGEPQHAVDKTINNDIGKVTNGELENWYWTQKKDAQPWMSNVKEFPAWVELRWPQQAAIGRVVVYAAPPWQWQGSLLDYELQYEKDGQWATIQRVQEPARTFKVFSPATRTSVDSFYSERWIFQHSFAPVKTARIRLLVHDVTWGGGATEDVTKAGGQTGPHQIMLREVEVFGK
jgi:hypothetical protein